MKENITREKEINSEQLGMLHKLLLKCQELGDQKVELVTQLVSLLDTKSKQLISDRKSIGNWRDYFYFWCWKITYLNFLIHREQKLSARY